MSITVPTPGITGPIEDTQPDLPELPGNPAGPTNTVLDDLVDAVGSYPKTYLTLEIFDVNPPGGAINRNEDITCKVRVHNSGPLNVNDLTVLVEALAGANGVKLHGGTSFGPSLISAVFPQVPGHMAVDTWVETPDGHYHFEAGQVSALADLVRVSINSWDADLDHVLLGHSDPRKNANDVYSDEVLAS